MNEFRCFKALTLLAALLFIASLVTASGPAEANPLNRWQVSCGVDRGAITRNGGSWTFRESANHCEGGIFNQRAELSTDSVSSSHRGSYLFSTNVSMSAADTEMFGLFQIHDARLGCAPPFVLYVQPSGHMRIASDVKTGPGESCIRGQLGIDSRGRFRRDGVEQDLKVLIDFDGTGAFDAFVWLDGQLEISGRYEPSRRPGAMLSERFYFKHGVYSQEVFDYTMTSRGMRVSRVRVR